MSKTKTPEQSDLVERIAKENGFMCGLNSESCYLLSSARTPFFLNIFTPGDESYRSAPRFRINIAYNPARCIDYNKRDFENTVFVKLMQSAGFMRGLEELMHKEGYYIYSDVDSMACFHIHCQIPAKDSSDVSGLQKFLKLVGDYTSEHYKPEEKEKSKQLAKP